MDKEIQTFGRQEQLFAGNGESTDLALMVDALAQEERSPWDASRIRDALMVEAGTDPATAESIALEVEEDLLKYGRTKVTTSIIREMVNVKLFQRGLDAKLADHSRIGLPVHDLETMMFNKNKENSNTSHNPESINLSIAEMVLKEYALTKVFSRDVADAHLKGDIHLHDLDIRMLVRDFLQYGRKHLARAAPGGEKVDEDCALRVEHLSCEVLFGCVYYIHIHTSPY